jgi:pantoate--beta-alanine ligase
MSLPELIRDPAAWQRRCVAARDSGVRIALVPTMGYLHEGHLSLVRRAREVAGPRGLVVVSLFVNPTQFNETSDLAAYPRDEARDAELSAGAGADLLFAPPVEEMYPAGFATSVTVSGVSEPLEGAQRGAVHFRGVATVVAKLLNIVAPDVAHFGQKDAQQALVVRRMVRDLDIPCEIEVCPTIRESDGLAMSSRNVRLAPHERPRALALVRGLEAARAAIDGGERDGARIERAGREAMGALGVVPEYFAVVSTRTLEPLATLRAGDDVLVAVAARVGAVRLIDNAIVRIEGAAT